MKQVKKIIKKICSKISNIFSKIIVVPISKLIYIITGKFDKKNKKFEHWLSKTNTLLFISLAMAVLIFIIIDQKILTYSESSAEVLTAQKITVEYDEDNYVVEGIPESVDITLIGNKADLYIAKQSPSNEVTIDLWGLKPGTHKVDIKYEQLSGSIKSNVNPSFATVIIYEKVSDTKTLSIDLLNQDSLDSKYVIDKVSTDEDTVVIKGASYKINQVATVKALVDINSLPKYELGKQFSVSSTLKAYDEAGNVVDVEISPSNINVDLLINSPSKEVPIKIITSGKVIYNMGISSFTINDSSSAMVTIYGPADVLSTIEYIPVNINVEGLSESTEFKEELKNPAGVKYMSMESVNINVNLSDNISNVEINDIGISHINLGSEYGVTPVDIDTITVKAKGVADIVKDITSEDINAYVDLQGLGVGTHDVDIVVEGNDSRVEYLSSVLKMKVKIYQK